GERACPDAVIGTHGRGTDHAQMFASNPGAEVVAVCDVDEATFERPIRIVREQTGKAPGSREIFDACVKSRSAPSAEIEIGHLSTRLERNKRLLISGPFPVRSRSRMYAVLG